MADDKEDGVKRQAGEPYAVGYGKPPAEHRFAKGQRGGPGRPKGSKNFATLVRKQISRTISVKVEGRMVRMMAGEGLLMRTIMDGLGGDQRAADRALGLIEKYGLSEESDQPASDISRLTLDEKRVLLHLMSKMQGQEQSYRDHQAQARETDNERNRTRGMPLRTEAGDEQDDRERFERILRESSPRSRESDDPTFEEINRMRAAEGQVVCWSTTGCAPNGW